MGRLGVSFLLANLSIKAFDQTGKTGKDKNFYHKNQIGQHQNIDDFICSANAHAHAQTPYILRQ